MKSEYKAKWVAALRSGKYEQARSALHQEGTGMCCLGVLCDIVKDEVGGRWDADIEDGELVSFRFAGDTGADTHYPPMDVYKLVGLDDVRVGRDILVNVEMAIDPCPTQHGLSILNDSGSYTFAQIADIIEEQL